NVKTESCKGRDSRPVAEVPVARWRLPSARVSVANGCNRVRSGLVQKKHFDSFSGFRQPLKGPKDLIKLDLNGHHLQTDSDVPNLQTDSDVSNLQTDSDVPLGDRHPDVHPHDGSHHIAVETRSQKQKGEAEVLTESRIIPCHARDRDLSPMLLWNDRLKNVSTDDSLSLSGLRSNSDVFMADFGTTVKQRKDKDREVLENRTNIINQEEQRTFSWVPMSICSLYTTSGTSTATFPGSDLLCGADGGLPKMAHVDYLVRSDLSSYEKERQRLRDLEVVNKRPASRGGKRGSYPFVDKEAYDREREDGRALNGQAIVKPQPYKGPTVSSSLAQRPNGSNSVRESDELIAMGTLFSPTNYVTANGVTRGSTSSTTTASSRSNQYGGPQNGPPTTNSVPQRKNITFSMNSTK
ncbi:unnamed protein product, partial [Lymnaea stagnalis]